MLHLGGWIVNETKSLTTVIRYHYFRSSAPWEIAAGLETTIQDDDDDELDLDENDPAIEELGFALAPKSKREKKKVI